MPDPYDPMSAVPGWAPRPAGQNPTATNYAPNQFSEALRHGSGTLGVNWGKSVVSTDRGSLDDPRRYQSQVIQALQQQAAGDMNSQAQQQLRDSFQRARAQQASLGSTMRGQSAGAAMRSIQAGQQGISRGQAGEEQMLKLQEQEAARAMLAQLLAQQQGLDIRQAGIGSDYRLGDTSLSDRGLLSSLGGDINKLISGKQYSNEVVGAMIGQNISQGDLNWRRGQQAAGAAGTATATLSDLLTPSKSPEYRQVDGQDSIVPYGEK